ncbi:hypothetical protein VNI00_007154 [Paramarasmius palmivorus]|uniref:F-box domain-containing protein n=1 Tax=Paramarasmius palmivorus TaxID=297713 RepID=A0AAW0D6Q9_9AGAR
MSTQLPLDITEQIISTLWLSPLSPSHRATFIKSSHLVSKMWDAVFSRVAAQDVYILSDSHSWRFLDIFSGRGTSHLRHLLDHLCRSITFEHEHKSLFPCPEEDEFGRAIYLVLRVISASPNRLPRLRRVALVVKDFLEETIFNDRPFLYMPSQVRELDINFWYGAETTSDTVFGIKLKTHIFERFHIPRGSLSFIRRLRVKGTSMAVVKLLLEAWGGGLGASLGIRAGYLEGETASW